jgi:uncharacterized protein (TIGR04255 family)
MSNSMSVEDFEVPRDQRLSVPEAPRRVYVQNFIATAVCELRIPTLIEIDPAEMNTIGHALRKRFPLSATVTDVDLGPGLNSANAEASQQYRTRDTKSIITIRRSALSVETTSYTSYERFREDIELLASTTSKLIDTDFFVRVGLRFVNVIPLSASLDGYINPLLTASLESKAFGRVRQHLTEVRGLARSRGEFSLRYGLLPRTDPRTKVGYTIDMDFGLQSVDALELMPVLDTFRDEAHNLFEWCIGDKTRALMSSTGKPLNRER